MATFGRGIIIGSEGKKEYLEEILYVIWLLVKLKKISIGHYFTVHNTFTWESIRLHEEGREGGEARRGGGEGRLYDMRGESDNYGYLSIFRSTPFICVYHKGAGWHGGNRGALSLTGSARNGERISDLLLRNSRVHIVVLCLLNYLSACTMYILV